MLLYGAERASQEGTIKVYLVSGRHLPESKAETEPMQCPVEPVPLPLYRIRGERDETMRLRPFTLSLKTKDR